MTATRRQTVFAGLDQPGTWPPTPRALRPQRLDLGLDSLPGVAAATQRKLGKLGLASVRDVLEHRPRRYETAADEVPIAALREGEEVVVSGRVLNVEKRPMRGRRRTRIVARVADDTATISVTWFNQPWLADRLKPGTEVRLRGKLGRFGFEPRSYDIGDEARATADFAPVYPAAEEIAAATVRRVVDATLPLALHVPDPLPAELREREGLALKRDALAAVHRPRDLGEAERGRQRLAFEELLVLQVGIARRAAERERTLAPGLEQPGDLIHRYRQALPFTLTPYQEQAIREIDGDLERTVPMQRLLQGDVGSGKTVVALYALLRAVENGRQGALMAPTETLAERRRERLFAFGHPPRDADLQDEQLLEREPLPGHLRLVEVAGPVHRGERVALQRQALALAQLCGQWVRHVDGERQRCIHDAPHGRGGNLLRGGIDRSEVGRRAQGCKRRRQSRRRAARRPRAFGAPGVVPDVVRARLEAEAAELPAQPDRRSRLQPVDEPRLVEPGDADRRRAVIHPRDDPRPVPPAHRPLLDVEDTTADDHLLALSQRRDRHLVGSGLVPPRPVLEDVTYRHEPEHPELPSGRGGDARQRVEVEAQAVRAQRPRRRRPGPGRVQACEDRLSTGGCHRPRHRAG